MHHEADWSLALTKRSCDRKRDLALDSVPGSGEFTCGTADAV
jgi:hypothetical protein